MEERILNEILKDTFTLDSLRKRVQLLKLILERDIYRPGSKDDINKSELELREEKWLQGFDKELITGMTSQMYSSFNERIEKFIESIVPLTIYFVFIPDETQIKAFGTWLRQNLDQSRLVFDLKVDPRLIGGCAFVYKGIYKDYSLRARISDNKDKIIGEFRKYFKQ
jgi:F0F1-type ATP synthase delta subunit